MLCGSQLCGWTRHGGSLLHSALRRVNPVCGSPASAEESHLTRSLFGQICGRIERLTWVVHRGGGGPGHGSNNDAARSVDMCRELPSRSSPTCLAAPPSG